MKFLIAVPDNALSRLGVTILFWTAVPGFKRKALHPFSGYIGVFPLCTRSQTLRLHPMQFFCMWLNHFRQLVFRLVIKVLWLLIDVPYMKCKIRIWSLAYEVTVLQLYNYLQLYEGLFVLSQVQAFKSRWLVELHIFPPFTYTITHTNSTSAPKSSSVIHQSAIDTATAPCHLGTGRSLAFHQVPREQTRP